MQLIFSEPIPLIVQIMATVAVVAIIAVGYRKNIFLSRFALITMTIEVIYIVVFLAYRYFGGAIAEEAAEEAYYALVASVHGIISLIAFACIFIIFPRAYKAYRGENYFKKHYIYSATMIISWILALVTGLFL